MLASGSRFIVQLRRFSMALVPPSHVRGMKKLDREAFTQEVEIPYLRLPAKRFQEVRSALKTYLLKVRLFKPVQICGEQRMVYLDPRRVSTPEDIPEDELRIGLSRTLVKLTYENWQPGEVLRAVLPEDLEAPTSYSQVGHVLHLNLREAQLPYKELIGQVYLDKVSHCRTVVNKTANIDAEFRNFSMEVLAGDLDTVVEAKENGCVYRLDFSRVYWNPRLGTERCLVTSTLEPGDVLYDAFAGVGPFAIPAARKGAVVLANDLNPDSYHWLQQNTKINKLKGETKLFCKDARAFLKEDVAKHLVERRRSGEKGCEHVVMNLPERALEFLDVFQDWLGPEEVRMVCTPLEVAPIVHLYCFVRPGRDGDPGEVALKKVEERLGYELKLPGQVLEVRFVRNVAPGKEMMRVSFRVCPPGLSEVSNANGGIELEVKRVGGQEARESNGNEARDTADEPIPISSEDITKNGTNSSVHRPTGDVNGSDFLVTRNVYVLPDSSGRFEVPVDSGNPRLEATTPSTLELLELPLPEAAMARELATLAARWRGIVAVDSHPQSGPDHRTRVTLEGPEDSTRAAKREALELLAEARRRRFLDRPAFGLDDARAVVAYAEGRPRVAESLDVVRRCYDRYPADQVFLSFNGGKDCTAVLHLVASVCKVRNLSKLLCLYVEEDTFPEVDEFVEQAERYYGLDIVRKRGPIKAALRSLLEEKEGLKAGIMGTRRNDPGAANVDAFTMTDPGWPAIMRVFPILDWSYADVWSFLLTNDVPYCSLYDKGYSSLGTKVNTKPNPLLVLDEEDSVYLPAFLLSEDSAERQGRR